MMMMMIMMMLMMMIMMMMIMTIMMMMIMMLMIMMMSNYCCLIIASTVPRWHVIVSTHGLTSKSDTDCTARVIFGGRATRTLRIEISGSSMISSGTVTFIRPHLIYKCYASTILVY
jgi:hypothetical protein